jgi:hypothetical protein
LRRIKSINTIIMIKWIKKFFKKSTESILVLDPAWEVKPKKKKKAKKKKKKKKSPYDEPWNGIV